MLLKKLLPDSQATQERFEFVRQWQSLE